jgi:hypothetical protein
MEIHQPGAFQGDAGLRDEAFQEGQITRAIAAEITTNSQRTCYSGFGDERDDDPSVLAVGLKGEVPIAGVVTEAPRLEDGTALADEVEQGPAVG